MLILIYVILSSFFIFMSLYSVSTAFPNCHKSMPLGRRCLQIKSRRGRRSDRILLKSLAPIRTDQFRKIVPDFSFRGSSCLPEHIRAQKLRWYPCLTNFERKKTLSFCLPIVLCSTTVREHSPFLPKLTTRSSKLFSLAIY